MSKKVGRFSRIRRMTILVHLKISRRINQGEILWEKSCAKLAASRWNKPPGIGSHQRRGVARSPVFLWIRFQNKGGRLLANVDRIPLAVQILQELHLLERVAGAKQLQQRIFVFGSGFRLRVQFFRAGE